jgi:ribosomal protein S14
VETWRFWLGRRVIFMLFAKLKDKKYREQFAKNEYKNKIYKYICIKLSCSKIKINKKFVKKALLILKKKYFYKSQKIKIIKRCILHNRAKSAIKPFNISRLIFRNLLQFGLIPGYKKAVW